jgi:hypothetical protein
MKQSLFLFQGSAFLSPYAKFILNITFTNVNLFKLIFNLINPLNFNLI